MCTPPNCGRFQPQAKKVLFVMRSCDYDEDVIVKGLSMLCLIFKNARTKGEVRLPVCHAPRPTCHPCTQPRATEHR
jgi:hypothetical protein